MAPIRFVSRAVVIAALFAALSKHHCTAAVLSNEELQAAAYATASIHKCTHIHTAYALCMHALVHWHCCTCRQGSPSSYANGSYGGTAVPQSREGSVSVAGGTGLRDGGGGGGGNGPGSSVAGGNRSKHPEVIQFFVLFFVLFFHYV
jgi:hypothetical protein